MFSLERWKRADLTALLVFAISISICCPFLVAIDDDEDGSVWLPDPGDGGGKGVTSANWIAFAGSDLLLPKPSVFNVALAIDAPWVLMPEVPECEAVPGLEISGKSNQVTLTLCTAGSSEEPTDPDARLLVTGPLGEILEVTTDSRSVVIDDLYTITTPLDDAVVGLFRLDVNAGELAESALGCAFLSDDLSGVGAENLHLEVFDGTVGEMRTYWQSDGSVDLSDLIRRAEPYLRDGVYDFGMILIGYDAGGEPVSMTNIILSADPNQGPDMPLFVRVFTLK